MAKEQWTFSTAWAAFRDVASWGLGAWWGNQQMTDSGPADPVKIALVAALLGLPFVFRADELRQIRRNEQPSGLNGETATSKEPLT